MRNLRAALSKEQAAAADAEIKVRGSGEVRRQLEVLQEYQLIDRPRLGELDRRLLGVSDELQAARLTHLKTEMDAEHAYRGLERLQLLAIDAAFPTSDESVRYLYAKIFSDNRCLACGNSAPESAAASQERLAENRCLVCGTSLVSAAVAPISGAALSRAREHVTETETSSRSALEQLEQVSAEHARLVAAFRILSASVASRDSEIQALVNRLPPEDAALIEQYAELSSLNSRVMAQTTELAELRSSFTAFIDVANRRIARSRRKIADTFQSFAGDFLLEDCKLVWALHKDRLGESGELIDFPGFELDLSSTNRSDMTRRDGPDQVSESQREFIDLAFRMTLMTAATRECVGSLVIDAPESSLDAVFVSRAAEVLSRFADPDSDNRLVITSNLIDGDLIPALMAHACIRTGKDPRVVDLLSLAAPTAAVTSHRADYEHVRRRLYARARSLQ
jgi:hypothetical protein